MGKHPFFDRLVRCSVHGRSFMRLQYINKHVHFVYVSAQKITVRLWIPVYTGSALVQYTKMIVAKLKQEEEDQKHKYNLE